MAVAAFALAPLAGCDFTPALDIETPAYEPGLVVRSVLVADSSAVVWVGESWDPYAGRPISRDHDDDGVVEADVALYRDGRLVERLVARRDSCVDFDQPPVPEGGTVLLVPCGPYAGTVAVEPGATYTVRAEADGYPAVEATVTVPLRPSVEVEETTEPGDGDRRFRVRLTDPPGAGDRYGLTLYGFRTRAYGTICENGVCRDTAYVISNPSFGRMAFDTSDPVLLAASREVVGSGVAFASFTDDTFDGRARTFAISTIDRYERGDVDEALRVQVAALSGDVYDLYQIVAFGGGSDNPFAEPINLPSNVVGGYGLVGAVALAEVTFAPRETPGER